MKGPTNRLRHDVRRTWECPVCQRRLKSSGKIVNVVCECQAARSPQERTWMKLIEENPRPRKQQDEKAALPEAPIETPAAATEADPAANA